MLLYELTRGAHKGIVINLKQVLYFVPDTQALVFQPGVHPLILNKPDWERVWQLVQVYLPEAAR